jgi:lysophospholipase L1-like esterase
MTAGTVSPTVTFRAFDAGLAQSYPFKLQTLLAARYSTQTLTVSNAGWAGKNAWEDRSRLASSIAESSPELVLLMEGANDLNSIAGLPSTNAAVDATVGSMEDMVRDTVGRGIPVILATLPAQRLPKGLAANLLPRYNAGLKTMASKKGATIVDINALLSPSLIGQDGLHPSEPGYQRMAEIFLDAIKQQYEVSPSVASR